MINSVILAGGVGSRLWPLSRKLYPKQFQNLVNEDSLFQNTLQRLNELDINKNIIVCNNEHRFIVAEQLHQIDKNGEIILETEGKNTAPAIALAAFNSQDDDILLVLPSDHHIKDIQAFQQTIKKAIPYAKKDYFVTFGIKPTSAQTGYGYIKGSDVLEEEIYKIDKFVEKPDKKTAQKYLKEGSYTWNSGMFMFKASTYLKTLKEQENLMFNFVQQSFESAVKDLDFIRPEKKYWEKIIGNSIDYAVMEKVDNAIVVSLDCGWSDLGAFDSLYELQEKDKNNNIILGDVINFNTTNSYINATNRLVATIGLNDCLVVETKDSVLVANKNNAQDIKKVVQQLEKNNRDEIITHKKVYRPWGCYESMSDKKHYQVKHIFIKSGAKLSLQKHKKRAEHWVVIKGIANVFLDLEEKILKENESIYIPMGSVHSLENKQKEDLEIIEVQTGDYFGEDDIERLEDIYGRIK